MALQLPPQHQRPDPEKAPAAKLRHGRGEAGAEVVLEDADARLAGQAVQSHEVARPHRDGG